MFGVTGAGVAGGGTSSDDNNARTYGPAYGPEKIHVTHKASLPAYVTTALPGGWCSLSAGPSSFHLPPPSLPGGEI